MGFFKRKSDTGAALRCSFCNKSQYLVKKLVAGPTVYICDECVDLCVDIIRETAEPQSSWPAEPAETEKTVWPADAAGNCTLCKIPMFVAEGLYVEGRGLFCSGCMAAIQNALATKN